MKITIGQLKYGFGKCDECQQVLSLDRFRQLDNDGQPERAKNCMTCESGVVFPLTDKQRASSKQNGRGEAYYAKQNLIQRAKNKPCADCGQRFPPVCMEFDHRPEHAKEYNIASMMNHRRELIDAEIAKCDIVCACCHRIRSSTRGWSGGRKKRVPTTASDTSAQSARLSSVAAHSEPPP